MLLSRAAFACSLALAAVLASALAAAPVAAKPAAPKPATHHPAASAKAAARGLAFAQGHCAACHGVTPNSSSPNPESPPFDDIANREGVSARSFKTFLSDAHNYPMAMAFTVPRAAIGDLAAYMLSLRKPGYRPTR